MKYDHLVLDTVQISDYNNKKILCVNHLVMINIINTFDFVITEKIKTLYLSQIYNLKNNFQEKNNFEQLEYLYIGDICFKFMFDMLLNLTNSSVYNIS